MAYQPYKYTIYLYSIYKYIVHKYIVRSPAQDYDRIGVKGVKFIWLTNIMEDFYI